MPSPLFCLCSTTIVFNSLFDVRMVRSDTSAATLREEVQGWRAQSGSRAAEWQCAACKTRSFLSRDTCRGCNKQRDVTHDGYINEWSQTAAWPQQGRGSSGDAARPVNKPKGPAQALALVRQQLAQAKAAELPEECIRILESKVQKEIQAQTDMDSHMQEAPLPVMPVPQVNVSLVKTMEALTGIIENMWNPDAGQPPKHLIHAIQESRANYSDLFGDPSLGCQVRHLTRS